MLLALAVGLAGPLPTVLLALAVGLAGPLVTVARADDLTKATTLFERGNERFQRALRLRGERRTRELSAALADYFESLRLVPSRNVLYNTALVLEQLERWDEAYNHWTEYLAVAGLSDAERADGESHRGALAARVAVLEVTSTPPGAEFWVDRRDLGSRGHTPTRVALPAGAHRIWAALEGHREAEASATATLGARVEVGLTLEHEGVAVQVLAPPGALTLDGAPIEAGASFRVPPGAHTLRLEVPGGAAVERRFEAVAGAPPMVVDLTGAAAAAAVTTSRLVVASARPARVLIDGVPRPRDEGSDHTLSEGEHLVRLEVAGAPAFEARRRFERGRTTTLALNAVPTSDSLRAGRWLTGIVSFPAFTWAVVAMGIAGSHRNTFNANPSEDAASATETWNLVADVSWGATAAVGVLAIVLAAVDDARTEASFEDEEASE